jgi:hypothetical protein
MHARRFGEILTRLVPLTPHDVDEILHEQFATGRRFGEIAISMGLCQAHHVWEAWGRQLESDSEPVDLLDIGVDSRATAMITPETARRARIIPIRSFGGEVIVAFEAGCKQQAVEQLPDSLRGRTRLVAVPADQLMAALERYYPTARGTTTDNGPQCTAA